MPRLAAAAVAVAVTIDGLARDLAVQPHLPSSRAMVRVLSFGAALLLEALIFGALFFGLEPKMFKPAPTPALQVSILSEATTPPKPQPTQPQLKVPPLRIELVPPLVDIPATTPSPITVPVPTSAAPVTPLFPPPPPPSGDPVLTFEGQVRQAVQAAVDRHYPTAARLLHQQGEADIGFQYLDGAVSAIELKQSSGLPLLDAAALGTVHDAHYPAPPPALVHQSIDFEVWVRFRLTAAS